MEGARYSYVYNAGTESSHRRYKYQCKCGRNSGRYWSTGARAMEELRVHVAQRHPGNDRFRPRPFAEI
ncbi:hypothetical protein [Streptomyces katrae]|uniref:Uncharacterized protein n=1 Tax=Streptomyces katrae TaxID=68223 RepID=A0A0F4JAH9_9ACTN|nr:hypothetical protein [Streptomyces katrae]KJY29956.1 hypothetical protein VR44_21535 [Streptomyces katrae]